MNSCLSIPAHFKHVDTLPCENLNSQNRSAQEVIEANCHVRLSRSIFLNICLVKYSLSNSITKWYSHQDINGPYIQQLSAVYIYRRVSPCSRVKLFSLELSVFRTDYNTTGYYNYLLQWPRPEQKAYKCGGRFTKYLTISHKIVVSHTHTHNRSSGKSGPKDQVALHCYYTSPSHWCTTHEVSKL